MRSVVLLTLVLSAPAGAWEHVGAAWVSEDLPMGYLHDDQEGGSCPESLGFGECVAATDAAAANWSDFACSDFSTENLGTVPLEDEPDTAIFDGQTSIWYAAEGVPGVLGYTVVLSSGVAFERNGVLYQAIDEADVFLSDAVQFGTQADLLMTDCLDTYNVQEVLAHELGHAAGLGHSCEAGDDCSDSDAFEALMYWSTDACSTSPEPKADDYAGLQALYGPTIEIDCGQDPDSGFVGGTAPLVVECTLTSNEALSGATWYFGDGGTAEGTEVTHVYETEGYYDIWVDAEGTGDTCESWEASARLNGAARVCELRQAEFAIERVQGFVYELKNNTGVNVVGCLTDARWAVYAGDGIEGEPIDRFENWEREYVFPEEGLYTVVLNVAGPAGVTAARATVEVDGRSGIPIVYGCNSLASPAGSGGAAIWGLLGLWMAALRTRRRA